MTPEDKKRAYEAEKAHQQQLDELRAQVATLATKLNENVKELVVVRDEARRLHAENEDLAHRLGVMYAYAQHMAEEARDASE